MMKLRIQTAPEDQSPGVDHAIAVPEFSLPDASFLLYGTFSQDGFDLVITNPAADKVTVADYFSFDVPPNLVLANGAGLTPAMVKSLFPRAFGDDVLFAGPAPSGAALTEIGTITLVVGTVTVRHADGSQDTLSRGDILFKGDVILTGAGSFVKAEMLDGTRFHLGQSGEVALDDFIYDEAAGQGQFDATIRVGGFYYKSGEISDMVSNLNRAHTTLKTPSAIIGVRGSELEGSVSPEGQTVVVHRSGILEITDVNGENSVTLVAPGNTAVVILDGSPVFSSEPPAAVETILEQSLLPPEDGNEIEVEEEAEDEDEAEAEEEEVEPKDAEPEDAEPEATEPEAAELEAAEAVSDAGDSQSVDNQLEDSGGSESRDTGTSQPMEVIDSVSNEVATQALSSLAPPDLPSGATELIEIQEEVVVEPVEEPLPVDLPPVTQPDTLDITDTAPIEISSLLLANDDDPDSIEQPAVISANGGTGSFEVDQGSVTYFPDQALLLSLGAGQTETQTISYEIESGGLQATGTLTVTYIGENEAPVLQSETAAISEDTLLELHVLDNATDSDLGDSLTITGLAIPATFTGSAEISPDGLFLIYSPAQDMDSGTRTEVFSYLVSDGTATSTATVTITVTGSNDAPVIESDSSSFSVGVASGQIEIPLSAIFSDSDSASELSVVALDSHSTQGSLLSRGSVLYDPGTIFNYLGEGETTTDSFNITVEDQNGATGQGTFTFQVIGVNDAPMAYSDTEELVENGSVSVTTEAGVLVNDEDPDTSDMLMVTSIRTGPESGSGGEVTPGDAIQGSYGTLTLHADGAFDYQANLAAADALAAGQTAVDVFTYTTSDDASTSLSDAAELSFTVTGINDVPTLLDATDVSATVVELEDLDPNELTGNITASGSFTFEDIDLETHTVSVLPAASNATNLGDISVTVTEDAGVDGSGLVEWGFSVIDADLNYLEAEQTLTQDYIVTVDDGQGGSFEQTVTVTLVGSHDPLITPPYQDSADIVHQQVVINEPYSETFSFLDRDGDTLSLSYAVPTSLAGFISGSMDSSAGTVVLTSNHTDPAILSEPLSGDYLLTVSADDGTFPAVSDVYILSVRDPEIYLVSGSHYFFAGETENLAIYTDDEIAIHLYSPQEDGDRVQVLGGDVSLIVHSQQGVTLTLEGGSIDLTGSPGQNIITLQGSVSIGGIATSMNDTVINETIVYSGDASSFLMNSHLVNNGTFIVSSAESGQSYAFLYGLDQYGINSIADPIILGLVTQGVDALLQVYPDEGQFVPYLITRDVENAGLIRVTGAVGNGYDYQVAVLEVLSEINLVQPSSGSIDQTSTGSLIIGPGGIITTGNLTNAGLVQLEGSIYAYRSAALIVNGTYTESGTFSSTSMQGEYAFYGSNRLEVAHLLLTETGQLHIDADLVLANSDQILDLRQGQVLLEPDSNMSVEGGSLIVGPQTNLSGFGIIWLEYGSRSDPVILIDTSFSISDWPKLDFSGGNVTIDNYSSSSISVFTIPAGTTLELVRNDVVNTQLENEGTIVVQGDGNAFNGGFSNNDNAVLFIEVYAGPNSILSNTDLSITTEFDNQGQIMILGHGVNSRNSTFTINVEFTESMTNSGLILISDEIHDVVKFEDGYGNVQLFDHDFNVALTGMIFNDGIILVEGGHVAVAGDVINSGVIRITGSTAGDSSQPSSVIGSRLEIEGNLILEPSSLLALEVDFDDSTMSLSISGLSSGAIGGSLSSTDLGSLSLSFDVNHNIYPDNDPATANPSTQSLTLFENLAPGVNFSNVLTNLAAGYDVSWSVVQGALNLQIADGMEVVANGIASFSAALASDDVRVIDALVIQDSSQQIGSFSLETWTSINGGSVAGSLTVGDSDELAESFELIVDGQSVIAPNSALYVGAGANGAGHDTSVLTLNALLTVNGSFSLDAGGKVNGLGSIIVSDGANAEINGGSLDIALTNSEGGAVNVGMSGGNHSLAGLGSITNHATLSLIGDLVIGVDIDNRAVAVIAGTSNVSLLAEEGITLTNTGVLLGDNSGDITLDLNNNALDTRGGELALFSEDALNVIIRGGASASNGVIILDGETIFTTAANQSSVNGALQLMGNLTLSLYGHVDFSSEDTLTLDGSNADSLSLVNGGAVPALFTNSQYALFNNLISASDVTLGNSNAMQISGSSAIAGDFYNLTSSHLFLDGEVSFSGNFYSESDSFITFGVSDAVVVSVVFANDFINNGTIYFEPSHADTHTIEFGAGSDVATFTNEGEFWVYGQETTGDMVLQGKVVNEGSFNINSNLTLNETSAAVIHENNGAMTIQQGIVVNLGADNTLVNTSSGHLVADNYNDTSTIDLSAAGASFINEGTLYLGDSYSVSSVYHGYGGLDFITSDASGEVVFDSGSELVIDTDLAAADPIFDQLSITSTGNSGGVLLINGGYLNIAQTQNSAAASAVIITAVSLLGSFDKVGGLISIGDGQGGSPLLDMVQTTTSITLEPVAAADVMQGSESADSIDMTTVTQVFVLAAAGDDVISHVDSGDTVYGQAGDDTFELSAIDVKHIDGGEGIDSIALPDVPTSFDFRASAGWLGTTFDNIEVLRMDDTSSQKLSLDASDIGRIVDGGNALVDGAEALLIVGNEGDEIVLYGDFEANQDTYTLIDEVPMLFSQVSEGEISLFFNQDTALTVHETDGGVSQYGIGADDLLTGTANSETLSGRAGSDHLDAGAGADRQLGGDGNDTISYDQQDIEIDGGVGADTVLISGQVNLNGVDNLANIEILDMSNDTADTLELNLSDVLDIVGDNSLNAYVTGNNKVLVINGDAQDTVLLDGLDIEFITPDASDVDLFGNGESYYLFQDDGVDLYVHGDLIDSNTALAGKGLDSYIHDKPIDSFGVS